MPNPQPPMQKSACHTPSTCVGEQEHRQREHHGERPGLADPQHVDAARAGERERERRDRDAAPRGRARSRRTTLTADRQRPREQPTVAATSSSRSAVGSRILPSSLPWSKWRGDVAVDPVGGAERGERATRPRPRWSAPQSSQRNSGTQSQPDERDDVRNGEDRGSASPGIVQGAAYVTAAHRPGDAAFGPRVGAGAVACSRHSIACACPVPS